MKQIINRKSYNTNTAKKVGYWDSKSGRSDFNRYEETLYLKKTGEYFLHVSGYKYSEYAELFGNERGTGEKIIPFTVEQAKSWSEKKISAGHYKKIFNEVIEEVTMTLRTTLTLKQKFDDLKRENEMTASELLDMLMYYMR